MHLEQVLALLEGDLLTSFSANHRQVHQLGLVLDLVVLVLVLVNVPFVSEDGSTRGESVESFLY